MGFTYTPAKLEGVGLFIAIAGSSRTGKTYTALRLGRGIAGADGRMAAIDTEGRRMSHYSAEFAFDVINLVRPFNGDRFVEAAIGAQDAGYSVLIIDSFSLEWSGMGGVLYEHDRQWAETSYNAKISDAIWNRVKGPNSEHRRMMNEFLQLTMPVIFCLRANEVAKHLGGGWKVEQDKRFLYEWTVGLTLHPETPGMPRYDMVDRDRKPLWKVQEQHRSLFPEGKLITEEAGAALQAWRNSAAARDLGSAAVHAPRRTFQDWLAELGDELKLCANREQVEAIVTRQDVDRALKMDRPELVSRLSELIGTTLRRFDADGTPA